MSRNSQLMVFLVVASLMLIIEGASGTSRLMGQSNISTTATAMAVSRDWTRVAVAVMEYEEGLEHERETSLSVIEMQTSTNLSIPFAEAATLDLIAALAWNLDSTELYVAMESGEIRRYNAASGELLAVFQHGRDYLNHMEIDPSGNRMLSVSISGRLELRALPSGQIIGSLDVQGYASGSMMYWAGWSPDGERIAIASRGGMVRILRSDDLSEVAVYRAGPQDYHNAVGAWSPDGAKLAIGGGGSPFRLIDLNTESQYSLGDTVEYIYAITWHPTTRYLATTSGRYLRVWDTDNMSVIHEEFRDVDSTSSLAWTQDGTGLIIGGAQGGAVPITIASNLPVPSVADVPTAPPSTGRSTWVGRR